MALSILPLSFVAGTAAIILSGALWAATLLRGTDKVIRYSVDTAALQLLYVPVSAETKVQAKSFLDTVVLRGGDGLGAVTVFLLTAVIVWVHRAQFQHWKFHLSIHLSLIHI